VSKELESETFFAPLRNARNAKSEKLELENTPPYISGANKSHNTAQRVGTCFSMSDVSINLQRVLSTEAMHGCIVDKTHHGTIVHMMYSKTGIAGSKLSSNCLASRKGGVAAGPWLFKRKWPALKPPANSRGNPRADVSKRPSTICHHPLLIWATRRATSFSHISPTTLEVHSGGISSD
jgi:hypothetical protein